MVKNKKENNDLQSNNDDEPKEDEPKESDIIYTEVERAPCSNPVKPVRPAPAEKSVYTTIDFVRTNQRVRKTRHDYEPDYY